MRTSSRSTHGVTNGHSGRFIPTHSLNESQTAFVREYVTNGGNRMEAAFVAGYSNPRTEGYRLLNTPKIRTAIQQEIQRAIGCEGASKGLKVMLELLEPTVPANVRFQAAKWLLEKAGRSETSQPRAESQTPKPLCLMSLAELEAFVRTGLS